nr:molybdate-anion transporter-like [Tanacetum cinerariifolium]
GEAKLLAEDWEGAVADMKAATEKSPHEGLMKAEKALKLSQRKYWYKILVFLGNGLVAILAGLFRNMLVGLLATGPVAPFDAASIFLAIGMASIISTWTENYGDPSDSKDLMTQFRGAAVAIASDEKIALLGAIQSLFEGSMYTFVFLWNPALSPNGKDIPHGFIFAIFMLSSMLGSSLASCLLTCSSIKVKSYNATCKLFLGSLLAQDCFPSS